MADRANATNSGLTRGKMILIAVLGVVFVGVLYLQFGRGSSGGGAEPSGYVPRRAPVAAASTATESGTPATAAETKTAVAAVTFVDAAKWKSPSLVDVVDYDPFALPEAFPKQQAVEMVDNSEDVAKAAAAEDSKKLADAILQVKSDLAELKQVGVQVIVRQGDQFVAMIGDRTVHVGEEIKGFKVTKIDPADGVVVERKAPE